MSKAYKGFASEAIAEIERPLREEHLQVYPYKREWETTRRKIMTRLSELQDTMNMDERFLTHREHHELTRLQAAEIERLQQQVGILLKAYELLRTATFGAHSAHFDPTHGSGSGCPECTRMREIRAEADNLSKRGE